MPVVTTLDVETKKVQPIVTAVSFILIVMKMECASVTPTGEIQMMKNLTVKCTPVTAIQDVQTAMVLMPISVIPVLAMQAMQLHGPTVNTKLSVSALTDGPELTVPSGWELVFLVVVTVLLQLNVLHTDVSMAPSSTRPPASVNALLISMEISVTTTSETVMYKIA